MEEAINEICQQIINTNADVVEKIARGHTNALQVLIGQAMKATKGKVHAKNLDQNLWNYSNSEILMKKRLLELFLFIIFFINK